MTPFWGFGGYQKWHFGCPNQNSETTFQYKLAPKTPKKPPQEPESALKKWFLAILHFFDILAPFSRLHGPFFSNAIPLIKINFFWVKLFFPGFLMYRPSWIRSILSIGPFFILGPRPTGHPTPGSINQQPRQPWLGDQRNLGGPKGVTALRCIFKRGAKRVL